MNKTIWITKHARSRQATRNLRDEDIMFVLQHGQRIRSGGVLQMFLGRRHIPANKATHRRFARLEGTVLVLDDTGDELVLITVYRNRRGTKTLRSKAKHDCSCNHRQSLGKQCAQRIVAA